MASSSSSASASVAIPPAHSFPPLQNDLLLRAARGEKTERTPVWCHRQAGRYLPEFKETRLQNGDFFQLCRTPAAACEVTLQPLRRFDLDAAIIFSDILVIPQAMGLNVEMKEAEGPVLTDPIRTPADLPRLKTISDVNVGESLKYVYDAITLTRHELKGKVPLIGFSGAPWTLMTYMVQGNLAKVKSNNAARAWFYKYPQESHALLAVITDVIVEYLILQVKAGAQLLEVFDTSAGDLSPAVFHQFIFPYLKAIAHRVKAGLRGSGYEAVPMTIFAKGAWWGFDALANDTEYDVLSVDWNITPQQARKMCGNKTIQGNLDPAVLYAHPKDIERQVERMVADFGPQRYIANLGHGMLPDHPIDGMKTLVQHVHYISQQINNGTYKPQPVVESGISASTTKQCSGTDSNTSSLRHWVLPITPVVALISMLLLKVWRSKQ